MATSNKRALVLSGGGEKGSWQGGALQALLEHLAVTTKHPDHAGYGGIFGVSVGALNGSHMAQFAPADQLEGLKGLKRVWWDIKNSKVFKHHNWLLRWLLVPWKRSVYDATPLRKLLIKMLDVNAMSLSGVAFQCGYVDLDTGEYKLGNTPDEVFSSASFPVMLSPGTVAGNLTTDGGIVHVTPLKAAIEWGATHVDVITLNPPGVPSWDRGSESWWKPKIHKQLLRVVEVMIEHIIEADLARCHKHNAEAKAGDRTKRTVHLRVFRPDAPIPTDSLDFNTKKMREQWQAGYDFVKAKLTSPE